VEMVLCVVKHRDNFAIKSVQNMRMFLLEDFRCIKLRFIQKWIFIL
jgi:hypothetical protein